jgi:hypothetical protein
MHTIKLNVGDGIYGHVMFFLKNLKTKELEIIEDTIADRTMQDDGIDFSQYKVESFKNIKDPVKWQKDIRSEWDR